MKMLKYLEKTLYFGLGLISYSAEKVEGFVNELVKKGEVASEDAKSLINELIEKGESQKEAIRKFIQEEVTKIQNNINAKKPDVVTRDDIREIIREELAKQQEPKDRE
jgi:polyhydroxyalkanoate synthesis regulator phasin